MVHLSGLGCVGNREASPPGRSAPTLSPLVLEGNCGHPLLPATLSANGRRSREPYRLACHNHADLNLGVRAMQSWWSFRFIRSVRTAGLAPLATWRASQIPIPRRSHESCGKALRLEGVKWKVIRGVTYSIIRRSMRPSGDEDIPQTVRPCRNLRRAGVL